MLAERLAQGLTRTLSTGPVGGPHCWQPQEGICPGSGTTGEGTQHRPAAPCPISEPEPYLSARALPGE